MPDRVPLIPLGSYAAARAITCLALLVGCGCNLLTGLSNVEIGSDGTGGITSTATGGSAASSGAGAGSGGDTSSAGTTTVTGGDAGSGGGTAPPPSPTCSATAGTGYYCGGNNVDNGDPNTLYSCDGPGAATVQAVCSDGCVVAPAGNDDYCATGACDGGPPTLEPPSTCNSSTSDELSPNGFYATSWFGCYREADNSIYQDPYDNCEFACGSQGLCDAALSGPECEADLAWFAADADRFGCGGRIRVTNCENGRSVVLATLDRGPNCGTVEQPCGAATLDMSHPAMDYLFEGSFFGACDQQPVFVEPVDPGTQLGPAN